MHQSRTDRKVVLQALLLLALCAILFWWRLGALGLTDPDETFYALTAREMLQRHDWLVPHIFGRPQFEKPILYFWMTMASFAAFGVSELAGRVVPALFATLLVLATWTFGRRHLGGRTGLWAGVVLASEVAGFGLARFMLTDLVLAAFLCGSMFCLWRALEEERGRLAWVVASAALGALAVLTKGPFTIAISVLAVGSFLVAARRRSPFRARHWLAGLAVYGLIAVPWYAYMLARFGRTYFDEFFVHENWDRLVIAEHPANNHLWYYPVVLLVGSIPWMPWVVLLIARAPGSIRAKAPRAFLWCWLLSSLVFMTVVQSKLPTYVFFLFVPLALLVGEAMEELLEGGRWRARERWAFVCAGVLQAAVLLGGVFALPEGDRSFTAPLVACGVLAGLGAALQLRSPRRLGIAATAAASVGLVVLLLGPAATTLESLTSVRGAVADLVRLRRADEPIVTDRLLARGVAYYARAPVVVLASDPNPWWTQHPLRVLVGESDFRSFVREHGPVVCLLRAKMWSKTGSEPLAREAADSRYLGGKIVKRVEPEPMGTR